MRHSIEEVTGLYFKLKNLIFYVRDAFVKIVILATCFATAYWQNVFQEKKKYTHTHTQLFCCQENISRPRCEYCQKMTVFGRPKTVCHPKSIHAKAENKLFNILVILGD